MCIRDSPLVCPPIREGALNRPKKPSGRHAARLRRDGITARLSCSFNFLATRGGVEGTDQQDRPQRCTRHGADDAGWTLPSGACEDVTQPEAADAADAS